MSNLFGWCSLIADSGNRVSLWAVMESYGIPGKCVNLRKSDYSSTRAKFSVYGCPVPPVLVKYVVDWVMHQALSGVQVGPNLSVGDLEFFDDIVVLGDHSTALRPILRRINDYAKPVGLETNVEDQSLLDMLRTSLPTNISPRCASRVCPSLRPSSSSAGDITFKPLILTVAIQRLVLPDRRPTKALIDIVKAAMGQLGLLNVYRVRRWKQTWMAIFSELVSDCRALAAMMRYLNEAGSSSGRC